VNATSPQLLHIEASPSEADEIAQLIHAEFPNCRVTRIASLEKLAEQLRREGFLREQRLESLGLSVGNIAHDLNNVLAPILLALDVFRSTSREPSTARLVEAIESHASYGAALVQQLLAFARGAEGQHVATDLRTVISEFAPMIRTALSRSVPVEIALGSDVPMVMADSTQLKQVLMNLCLNARDAMANGGQLSLALRRMELTAPAPSLHPNALPGCYAVLSVTDTGSGIPPWDLDRIFDPFYTTKAPGEGTGLGLSTVRGIVKGHGGFMTVESEVGRGSTFRIFLPRALPETRPIDSSAAISTPVQPHHAGGVQPAEAAESPYGWPP
jgi:signal transduction histidine kinase